MTAVSMLGCECRGRLSLSRLCRALSEAAVMAVPAGHFVPASPCTAVSLDAPISLYGVSFSSNLELLGRLRRGAGCSALGPQGARSMPGRPATGSVSLRPPLRRTLAWQQPQHQILKLRGEP